MSDYIQKLVHGTSAKPYVRPENRSKTTDRLICPCKRGYASEDKDGEHYGICRPCWVSSLTRREMKEKGIKSRY
jgi:hypothetical protein